MNLRRLPFVALAFVLAVAATTAGRRTLFAADEPLSVRITSPLGRTGAAGDVRIVARIEMPPGTMLKPIRFFIDGMPYKVDDDGPPYAVEWADENPFERREISVEVEDTAGHIARDRVVLEPYEIVEKTQVFSVLLEASVRDKAGRFVKNLDSRYFTVTEDGNVEQPSLIRQESLPTTFALLVDSSQSMSRRFDFVRAAVGRLVNYLHPNDRVIVAPFTKSLLPLTGPTNDRETVAGAIGAVQAKGGTAIFDALVELAERLKPLEGRRVVVLITDGYDENSKATLEDAVRAIQESQLSVYVVAIGGVAGISLKGERQLRSLVIDTGGRVYFPPRVEELAGVYDQLAADAQNRYFLSYTPRNQQQDGTWRKIDVAARASNEDYVVTTRDGYFAPQAPPVRATVEFTVTDLQQQLVDVTRDDLVVVEDGVEQKIDSFSIAVDPVQIILTLDESGSMRMAVDAVKSAARSFVDALERKDPLALITFSDKSKFAHDLTTNRQWSYEAIDKYQALGGTALYDALYDSLMRLKFVQGRRAVVVMTDGRDENNPGTAPGSLHTLQEVLAAAHDVNALIYPIGLGPRVDRELLERLAQISGGTAYFPAAATDLTDQYHSIVENLRRRYVLEYNSTNRKRDGSWRVVEIKSKDGSLQVKSRGGYNAPDK